MAEINRRKRMIVNIAYWALIGLLVFAAFKYLFGLLWPFLLAFSFSWLLRPAIRYMTLRWHLRYNLSALVCLLLFFALLCCGLYLLVSKLITSGLDLVASLPELYMNTVEPNLRQALARLETFALELNPELYAAVDAALPDFIASLNSMVSSLSMNAVSAVTGFITALPKTLLSLLICVIATIFMTLDYPHISAFLLRQIPEGFKRLATKTLESLKNVVGQYARGYLIIMAITFGEIFLGLVLIRQKNALVIAALIALFDLFPIVGAGLILLPWSIVSFAAGVCARGAGLLALWVIVIVLRQLLEPRIVGRSVGLHPLVTLMSMFVGTKLFGGIGLFGLPVTCAIVKSLDDGGVIHLIRKDSPIWVNTEEKIKKNSKTRAEGY